MLGVALTGDVAGAKLLMLKLKTATAGAPWYNRWVESISTADSAPFFWVELSKLLTQGRWDSGAGDVGGDIALLRKLDILINTGVNTATGVAYFRPDFPGAWWNPGELTFGPSTSSPARIAIGSKFVPGYATDPLMTTIAVHAAQTELAYTWCMPLAGFDRHSSVVDMWTTLAAADRPAVKRYFEGAFKLCHADVAVRIKAYVNVLREMLILHWFFDSLERYLKRAYGATDSAALYSLVSMYWDRQGGPGDRARNWIMYCRDKLLIPLEKWKSGRDRFIDDYMPGVIRAALLSGLQFSASYGVRCVQPYTQEDYIAISTRNMFVRTGLPVPGEIARAYDLALRGDIRSVTQRGGYITVASGRITAQSQNPQGWLNPAWGIGGAQTPAVPALLGSVSWLESDDSSRRIEVTRFNGKQVIARAVQ